MKCPQCVEQELRSTVQIGPSTRTLMASYAYYDEDGNLHHDDPNKTTTSYVCSNGHRWSESK